MTPRPRVNDRPAPPLPTVDDVQRALVEVQGAGVLVFPTTGGLTLLREIKRDRFVQLAGRWLTFRELVRAGAAELTPEQDRVVRAWSGTLSAAYERVFGRALEGRGGRRVRDLNWLGYDYWWTGVYYGGGQPGHQKDPDDPVATVVGTSFDRRVEREAASTAEPQLSQPANARVYFGVRMAGAFGAGPGPA